MCKVNRSAQQIREIREIRGREKMRNVNYSAQTLLPLVITKLIWRKKVILAVLSFNCSS